ncbi:MAG: ATP-binding protein, partial [Candidatus Omnitrophota bacterium]
AVLAKIRNLTVRFLPPKTLFPIEATQYDQAVIREALHNCVAHQDYTRNSRINVVEFPDEVLFDNAGSFIPGSVEAVIEQNAPQREYRNPFLAQAMVNLGMIETEGGGIKEMFTIQRRRFFPLPTYELDKPDEVKVHIPGKIIDDNYTRLLVTNAELDLRTVMLLDKVQKKRVVAREEHIFLKKKKLVEGRYPNIFVVSKIAAVTGDRVSYIKNRAFDADYYKKLVINFITEYGSATKGEINKLLMDKLSDVLTEIQKKNKINNLLNQMANKEKIIKNQGTDRMPKWVFCRHK